jgi:hypothetical protein
LIRISASAKQFVTEETESSVISVESIMMLLAIAIYEHLPSSNLGQYYFSIYVDFNDQADKHKWVHLDKLAVDILIVHVQENLKNIC